MIPESQLPAHNRVVLMTVTIQTLFPGSGLHVARLMAVALESGDYAHVGQLFEQVIERETEL